MQKKMLPMWELIVVMTEAMGIKRISGLFVNIVSFGECIIPVILASLRHHFNTIYFHVVIE
jgi:hypothetical protein